MGYESKNMDEDLLRKVDCIVHTPKGGVEVKPVKHGDFSDFNRIFYLAGNPNMEESLLLFSKIRQKFIQVNTTKNAFSIECTIDSGGVYEEAEIFDQKLFCVQKAPLTLDVFFSSKKKRFFHKRSFHFKDKDLEFKKQIQFIAWKHDDADVGYRCLLGPLKDGRFIHFTLGKKNFSNQEPLEQLIDRVFFVSLALDSEKETPPDIAASLKPDKNTILCFDKEKRYFFEYGEFAGIDSMKLEILNCDKIPAEKLNRMYLHYPYDHYTKSVKKRIKKNVSLACPPNIDIDKFARNRYKEILLCMEDGPLYTMRLANRNRSFDAKEFQWEILVAATGNQILPVDIALDESSGKLYVLYQNWIYCLKPEEEKEKIAKRIKSKRESSLINMYWDS